MGRHDLQFVTSVCLCPLASLFLSVFLIGDRDFDARLFSDGQPSADMAITNVRPGLCEYP